MKSVILVLALCLGVANAGARSNLTIYFEAMSPDCQELITNQLSRVLGVFIPTQIMYNLQPFGNARMNATGGFECQHGEDECLVHAWMACYNHQVNPIVYSYGNAQYAICLMSHPGNMLDFVETCAGDLAAQTKKCVESKGYLPYFKEYYQNIQAAYAMIHPNERGVPLVFVDEAPYFGPEDLVNAVCDYSRVRPSVC